MEEKGSAAGEGEFWRLWQWRPSPSHFDSKNLSLVCRRNFTVTWDMVAFLGLAIREHERVSWPLYSVL